METPDMYICREHQIPLIYRGPTCPWCDFIADMKTYAEGEYKRGYEAGMQDGAAIERKKHASGAAEPGPA